MFKNYFSFLLLLSAGILINPSAPAQTVTVDASLVMPDGVTTFNSLQTALESFQADGHSGPGVNHGQGAADVIEVIATGGVVDEPIIADRQGLGQDRVELDEDLTIRGAGGMAVIALQQSSLGSIANDCGLFFRQDVNLRLENLAFIPSRNQTPTDDGLYFRSSTQSSTSTITLRNVVITSNDGADQPVTLTGLDRPDLAGATGFGDDALYLVSQKDGGRITLDAENLVISAFSTQQSFNDALVVFMGGAVQDVINAFVRLGPGCVITHVPRFGIQNSFGGSVQLAGTKTDPVILAHIGGDGIWCFSDNDGPTQASVLEVEGAIIHDCSGAGIREEEEKGRGFINSVSASLISQCGGPGIALFANGQVPDNYSTALGIQKVTFHNCGFNANPGSDYDFLAGAVVAPLFRNSNRSNRNVLIKDCIITGKGLTGLYNSGFGRFVVENTALVNYAPADPAHDYELAQTVDGSGTIDLEPTVYYVSPHYSSFGTGDYLQDAYLDVENDYYIDRASDGGPLVGGADFAGGIHIGDPTGLDDWMNYR